MNAAPSVNGLHGLGQTAPRGAARRTIPFDYSFQFALKPQPGLVQNSTITVSTEGSFTVLSMGYGVVPKVSPIKFGSVPPRSLESSQPPPFLNTSFGSIVAALSEALKEPPPQSVPTPRLGPRTATVLRDGIRLNPAFVEQILTAFGGSAFDPKILAEAFQTVAAPPDGIQFKYALFDDGTGREFQSEPILNTAGLGSADGKRPFRYFARPIEFAPHARIRMEITEISEFQGDLHVTLHGYKTLGGAGTPTDVNQAKMRRTRR
jgi:hypothetical protein